MNEKELLDKLAKGTVYFVSDKGEEFAFKDWQEMKEYLLDKNKHTSHNLLIDFSKLVVAEHKLEMEELLSQFAFDYQIPIAHADSLMTITELVKEFLKKEGVSE